jgi:hypothetical protein
MKGFQEWFRLAPVQTKINQNQAMGFALDLKSG